MRLTHICCCCLLYQLGVLSNGIVSGEFCRDFRLAFQLPQRKPGTHGEAGLVQPVRGEQDSVGSNKKERAGADEGVMLERNALLSTSF